MEAQTKLQINQHKPKKGKKRKLNKSDRNSQVQITLFKSQIQSTNPYPYYIHIVPTSSRDRRDIPSHHCHRCTKKLPRKNKK